MKRLCFLTCGWLLLGLLSAAPLAAQEYTITDLGVLSANTGWSEGYGISPSGQYVTGWGFDSSYNYRAFRWDAVGGMRSIDSTKVGAGNAVNDSGHIAGMIMDSSYGPFCAYYDGTSLKTLGPPGPLYNSPKGYAYGINSQNTLCGQGIWGWYFGTLDIQALWYRPGIGAYGIGRLPGAGSRDSSIAYAVNENGTIAGSSAYGATGDQQHCFLWTPSAPNGRTGTMIDVHTTADYTQSCARAINDSDEIAGYCWSSYGDNNRRAFYKPASGPMQILPSIAGGYDATEADGINDSGMVVGSAGYLNDRGSGACFAVRWVCGQVQLLRDCIDLRSNWELHEAKGINDLGYIVGTGRINNETHAFALTPIANPTVNPTPQINSVDPASMRARDLPQVLHIYGSGFTEGSVVFCVEASWVYPQRLATTFVSESQVDVNLTDSGLSSVWVLNPKPGGGESNHVGITIAQNRSPNAVYDEATTSQDTSVDIDVLANDSDPDGDPISVLSAGWYSIYPYGSDGTTEYGGTVSVQSVDGKSVVRYTPPAGFTGYDDFLYRVADDLGYWTIGTVYVEVVAHPNAPPVAVDDSAYCLLDSSVEIDVLANDSDPDLGDTISITSGTGDTTQGGYAYVSTSETGKQTFYYNPPAEFLGTDTFTYTITDNYGASSTATVTVNVIDHFPPVAVDDVVSIDIDTTAYIYVLNNDIDPNGGSLTIDSATSPGHGTATVNSQYIEYVPEYGFQGTDTFTYTVSNSYGDTATATVTVNVGLGLQIDQCYLNPWTVAGGDKMWARAHVSDSLGQVVSVTANGMEMSEVSPGSWELQVTADAPIGWNYVYVEATDTIGQTRQAWIYYRTYPVYATNTKALSDRIMATASNNALFAVCGQVTRIDDYRFWLDDGGDGVLVYTWFGPHGFSDGDTVRARGKYYYYDNPADRELEIGSSEQVNKLE